MPRRRPTPGSGSSGERGLSQKKALSQVFLKVDWPVKRMVQLLGDQGVTSVVEIGPGGGVLTRELLNAGMSVTAVEKDPRFAAHLEQQKALWESLAPGKLTVVAADVLRTDLRQWLQGPGKHAVVGNIPYHISSPIVQQVTPLLMERVAQPLTACLLMTQREFAARVAAAPGTKDFGSLSVYVQLRAQAQLAFDVGRECFQPVPKVDSAVLALQPLAARHSDELLAATEQVTRVAFSQRRKKLSNSIATLISGADTDRGSPPVDLSRRADDLSPHEFATLAGWIFAIKVPNALF